MTLNDAVEPRGSVSWLSEQAKQSKAKGSKARQASGERRGFDNSEVSAMDSPHPLLHGTVRPENTALFCTVTPSTLQLLLHTSFNLGTAARRRLQLVPRWFLIAFHISCDCRSAYPPSRFNSNPFHPFANK